MLDYGLGVMGGGELGKAMAEMTDSGEDELLSSLKLVLEPTKGLMITLNYGMKDLRLTSASAISSGLWIHFTVHPSFSMALTSDRTLPAT